MSRRIDASAAQEQKEACEEIEPHNKEVKVVEESRINVRSTRLLLYHPIPVMRGTKPSTMSYYIRVQLGYKFQALGYDFSHRR